MTEQYRAQLQAQVQTVTIQISDDFRALEEFKDSDPAKLIAAQKIQELHLQQQILLDDYIQSLKASSNDQNFTSAMESYPPNFARNISLMPQASGEFDDAQMKFKNLFSDLERSLLQSFRAHQEFMTGPFKTLRKKYLKLVIHGSCVLIRDPSNKTMEADLEKVNHYILSQMEELGNQFYKELEVLKIVYQKQFPNSQQEENIQNQVLSIGTLKTFEPPGKSFQEDSDVHPNQEEKPSFSASMEREDRHQSQQFENNKKLEVKDNETKRWTQPSIKDIKNPPLMTVHQDLYEEEKQDENSPLGNDYSKNQFGLERISIVAAQELIPEERKDNFSSRFLARYHEDHPLELSQQPPIQPEVLEEVQMEEESSYSVYSQSLYDENDIGVPPQMYDYQNWSGVLFDESSSNGSSETREE